MWEQQFFKRSPLTKLNNSDRKFISQQKSIAINQTSKLRSQIHSHNKAIALNQISKTAIAFSSHHHKAIAPIKNKQIAIAYSSSLQQGDHS